MSTGFGNTRIARDFPKHDFGPMVETKSRLEGAKDRIGWKPQRLIVWSTSRSFVEKANRKK